MSAVSHAVPALSTTHTKLSSIRHHFRTVAGVEMFYREAGDPNAPGIVLLPSHPSGAHAYNGLIARLAASWHVVAPDYPGYGFSAVPAGARWTFDWLADISNDFLEQLGLDRYVMYMFGFGAPVGFRIAEAHPHRVAGIVTQNGNIYVDGFGPGLAALADWWNDRAAGQAAVDGFLTIAGTKLQWEAGARDAAAIDPAMWNLDQALLDLPGRKNVAEALLWDYQNNPGRYPDWQAYLRQHRPPLLAIWGANDPFFIAPGAEAYKRDLPTAQVVLLDTGHFALVEEVDTIAERVDRFLHDVYANDVALRGDGKCAT
jgi:pimeloyl-ACP methyl ester carboxylesterase